MAPILDGVSDLLKLSQDELSEKLLDRKYNSANLRGPAAIHHFIKEEE